MSLHLKFSFRFLLLLCFASSVVMAQKPELLVQTGHSDNVTAVVYSPDGKLLASGSIDGVIKFWDVATGLELRTLGGHSVSLNDIDFSPDGKILAAGTGDFKVKLWDVATGTELRILKGHTRPVRTVDFSPDGKTIVSGSGDNYYGKGENTIKIWNVSTGAELHTLTGHSAAVVAVEFSSDGAIIASGSVDKRIKLWDAATGKLLRTIEDRSSEICALAFAPDGRTLASGGNDKTIKIWEVATRRVLQTLRGHSNDIYTLAFSPNGATLASGSGDKTIRLWDAATGAERGTLIGHPRAVFHVTFSPDGKTLASGGSEQILKLWEVATGKEMRTLRRRGVINGSVAFSPDAKTLAGGGIGPVIKLWDIATGQEPRTLKGASVPRPEHLDGGNLTDSVNCLAYSPDGKILASANLNDTIELWDAVTGKALHQLKGHTHMVNSLSFSLDSRLLASTSNDFSIRLWDVKSGKQQLLLAGHVGPVWAVAFSRDGMMLASGGYDKTLRLWDATTGKQVDILKGHTDEVFAVGFSPDGQTLASSSFDNSVRLWNVQTRKQLHLLEGYGLFVAFSSDGRILACGTDHAGIKLWDTASGRELHRFKGHTGRILGGAFTPDAKVLATASTDSTIMLWDVETGKELLTLIALDEQDWLVIAPDGLFDGSSVAWNQILWRFSPTLYDVAPVEAFFNEFFYPGLLTDILAGKRPHAVKDISLKDRRQPRVTLSLIEGQTTTGGNIDSRKINVRINVSELLADKEHPLGSGAQDLKLFRNGSLVKVFRGDALRGQEAGGCKPSVTGGAICDATIPITAGDNHLVAYAFNQDNIKSGDASLTVVGAESLKRKGVAYVLTVGINSYDNQQYNLKYAVADAQDFGAEVKRQQERIGHYERVEVLSLYDKDAVKAGIIKAFIQLAAKIQPEDALLVYFAGHGAAAKDRFYLIPHDTGYTGSRLELTQTGLDTILQHSFSDKELERAFEGIDAGQILFVIDACNSGQALEAEEKRRGPMNSKGLAQLAYDKGIFILTAAQSYQAALEVSSLGHGLLTYALVEEGLKKGAADEKPLDKQILLREWLNYATRRVPELQEEKMQALKTGQERILEQEEIVRDPSKRSLQRPRLFVRRERETREFVIARP